MKDGPGCNRAAETINKINTCEERLNAAFFILAKFCVLNSPIQMMEQKLAERKLAGNFRQLSAENNLIDFCSNDYLGFARSPEMRQLIEAEMSNYAEHKSGATGSRLISGNLSYTERLEQHIAGYHNAQAGLIFNSGYDANTGLFSAILQRGDTVIADELIHASIIDGIRLSHANRFTFRHNDMESLEGKLKNAKGLCYVVIESVYSMDGDAPPLGEIINLCSTYHANLIVDEAHALGLFSKGMVSELQFEQKVFARIITFGKALGCHGAIVLGSPLLREYLINFARSFIYTTALPFHALASIRVAYQLLQTATGEISKLKNNIALFKKYLNVNERLIKSDSQIQCILVADNVLARKIALSLRQFYLDVRPILHPTVAQGTERLRICLHSFNSLEEIKQLTTQINFLINA
jgi:8-amino-7-oxononanoate synthase